MRILYMVLFSACALFAFTAVAEEPAAAVRISVTLTDGSMIIGIPKERELAVETSFSGGTSISLRAMSRMEFQQSEGAARITFQNGDTITVQPQFEALTLETLFGEVVVQTQHMTSLRILDHAVLPTSFQEGLLLHYSFDRIGGGEVQGLRGNGRHGTLHNVEWSPVGKVGGAVQFSGKGSFIKGRDEGLPDGDAPRSVAFWVKPTSSVDAGGPVLLYGTRQWYQAVYVGIDWRHGRNSIAFSPHGAVDVASTKFDLNAWYHVVYTYGGQGQHTLYVNGEPSAHQVRELRGPIKTKLTGDLLIGSDGAQSYFVGWVDELLLYDRVLSAAEATALYALH